MRVVLVSGVAGAGKSTVGRALAAHLGWAFVEGDTLHPAANVAKMQAGEPLTDADRGPWLADLRKCIDEHLERDIPAVISTSALKRSYRDALRVGHARVLLVYLEATRELVAERLATRLDHFFGAELLHSQFEALEPPSRGALVLPAELPVETLVERIARRVSDTPQ